MFVDFLNHYLLSVCSLESTCLFVCLIVVCSCIFLKFDVAFVTFLNAGVARAVHGLLNKKSIRFPKRYIFEEHP